MFFESKLRLATSFCTYRHAYFSRTFETLSTTLRTNKKITEELELIPPSFLVTYGSIAVPNVLKVTAEVFDNSPLKTCEKTIIDSRHQGRSNILIC